MSPSRHLLIQRATTDCTGQTYSVSSGRHASSGSWWLSVVVPCVLIVLILGADLREGPKTAYVGVLTAVPLFAAIFGTPIMTAVTSVITWCSAFTFGLMSTDGNVPAQTVRLGIIALAGAVAVAAAYVRQRRDEQFQRAQRTAAEADVLRLQAGRDYLTGLLNRRGLIERLAVDPPAQGTVIVLDCDRFKDVNDRYGHVVGDEFLKGVAGRLSSGLSQEDFIARWGGDEFLLVLRTPFDGGIAVAQRVVDHVTSSPMSTSAGLVPVSLSAGAAPFEAPLGLDAAIAGADRAMYKGRSSGVGVLGVDYSP